MDVKIRELFVFYSFLDRSYPMNELCSDSDHYRVGRRLFVAGWVAARVKTGQGDAAMSRQ
jgi:hypothetical protein